MLFIIVPVVSGLLFFYMVMVIVPLVLLRKKKMYSKFTGKYKVNVFSRKNQLTSDYSTRDMARDLREAMEQLNISKADILSNVLCSVPRIPHDLLLYRMVNDEFIDMLIEKIDKSCRLLYKKRVL